MDFEEMSEPWQQLPQNDTVGILLAHEMPTTCLLKEVDNNIVNAMNDEDLVPVATAYSTLGLLSEKKQRRRRQCVFGTNVENYDVINRETKDVGSVASPAAIQMENINVISSLDKDGFVQMLLDMSDSEEQETQVNQMHNDLNDVSDKIDCAQILLEISDSKEQETQNHVYIDVSVNSDEQSYDDHVDVDSRLETQAEVTLQPSDTDKKRKATSEMNAAFFLTSSGKAPLSNDTEKVSSSQSDVEHIPTQDVPVLILPSKHSSHNILGNEKRDQETSETIFSDMEDAKIETATASLQDEENNFEHEPEQPDQDAIIASTDNLFAQVHDKTKVTVRDIVMSLEAEYDCKLEKETKMIVRQRLTQLINGEVEVDKNGSVDDEDVGISDVGDVDDEESDEASCSENDGDDEKESIDSKGQLRGKNIRAEKKKRMKKPKPLSKKIKASALRIHAEALRKKRMEELRVRNEELQVHQNEEDQKRAELIAAKFETNTDELRMKRLEQRLDLLEKLSQKRITMLQTDTTVMTLPKEEISYPQEQPRVVSQILEDLNANKDGDIDEDKSSSSDEELELEVVKPDALTVLDIADRPFLRHRRFKKPTTHFSGLAGPDKSLNDRALLKTKLLSKQRKMGNMWLARELGYKTEQEHIHDCLEAEQQKRQTTLKREEARMQQQEKLRERMLAECVLDKDDTAEMDDTYEADSDERDLSELRNDSENDDDDEELAMAKALRKEKDLNSQAVVTQIEATEESNITNIIEKEGSLSASIQAGVVEDNYDVDVVETKEPHSAPFQSEIVRNNDKVDVVDMNVSHFSEGSNIHPFNDSSTAVEENDKETQFLQTQDLSVQNWVTPTPSLFNNNIDNENEAIESTNSVEIVTATVDTSLGTKGQETKNNGNDDNEKKNIGKKNQIPGSRNSAWKALLQKEAELAKKAKKKRGAGLVEDEADEEEEDAIAGLEDFGFTLNKKKQNEDDEIEAKADEITEDDLKHVVDELSEDEGDEEAGVVARKKLMQKEEKVRHAEIMRRVRDGFDGRRGGIAVGGSGARGLHRFDQLVAADNREDAKRLGLLNDDELGSDDDDDEEEEETDKIVNEVEDEAELLDKMLKNRFLHRSSAEIDEVFSEDEGIEKPDENQKPVTNDDEEEREQQRLAKRFAKRARMHRLFEAHGHEEEFSQSRLIEEDATMKQELQNMRNGLSCKRSYSVNPSQDSLTNSNLSLGFNKKQKTTGRLFTTAIPGCSLALALQSGRHQARTLFFTRSNSTGTNNISSHLTFGSQTLSNLPIDTSNSSKRSGNVPVKKGMATKSDTLWSKAVVQGFQPRTSKS